MYIIYNTHATVGLHLLSIGHACNKEPWVVSNSDRDIASVRSSEAAGDAVGLRRNKTPA